MTTTDQIVYRRLLSRLSPALKKAEWQLRISLVSESVRWAEIARRYPEEPRLLQLAELTATQAREEAALPEEQPAAPPNLTLGKKRPWLGGHEPRRK